MRGDTFRRVLVAVPLAILAVALVAAGGWVLAAGLAVVGVICLHEFYELVETRRPVKVAGFLSMIAIVIAAELGGVSAVLFCGWATLPLVFVLTVSRPRVDDSSDSIFATAFGVWWIAIALGLALLLREMPHGAGVLLIALVATFASDIGSYFGGRSLGTRPLAPRISPRKTVEGLLSGIAASIVVAALSTLYAGWLGFGEAVLIGITVSLLAPCGDLFESLLKRDAGAKDTANTLGPHGGLLDRLDGVLFSVVGVYWVWTLLS